MKKITFATAMVAGCLSQVSYADFFGIYAGASIWQATPSGQVQDIGVGIQFNTSIDVENDLGFGEENTNMFYLAFEHPIPLLPNLRAQHTELIATTSAQLSRDITFAGIDYQVDSQVSAIADLTHTDGTIYWELWDLIAEVDLGITGRLFDGLVEISSDTSINNNGGVSLRGFREFSAGIPLVYGKVGVKVPFTGLSASVSANAISLPDVELMDIMARINYEVDFGLGAEVGYRLMELDIVDDIVADISVEGFYAGISYHF